MKHKGIPLRAILILISVLIFLSTVTSVLLIMNYMEKVNSYRDNLYDLKLDECENSIKRKLRDYSMAMEITALNPTIRNNIFRQDVDYATMAEIGSPMRNAVNSTTYLLTEGSYVDSYVFYTYLPSDGRTFFPIKNMESQTWYQQYIDAGGSELSTFTSFVSNKYYNRSYNTHQFVIVKPVNDFNTTVSAVKNTICYQAMSINLSGIISESKSNKDKVNAQIYMFNSDNDELVYANSTSKQEDAFLAYKYAKTNSLSAFKNYVTADKIQSEEMMGVKKISEMNAYAVLVFDPIKDPITTPNYEFTTATIVVIIFIILTMLLVIFYFNYRKRINGIINILDNFDETIKPSEIPSASNADEISKMEKHIVLMQNKIRVLIEEEYKMKVKNVSAQYEALTACINPHFLYNTLNSISAMASLEDADDTNKMIMALSDMFKYSADMSQRKVTLEEELKNISDYLYIQGIRYNDSFNYRVDVNDSLLKCEVPKLVLQPVVENCFKHGFSKRKRTDDIKKDEVFVCAVKEGSNLKIYVMDNGKGFDEEKLEEFNKTLLQSENEKLLNSSPEIGLINVHRRLKLLYGDEYGIAISCEKNNYTCIELKMIYEEK